MYGRCETCPVNYSVEDATRHDSSLGGSHKRTIMLWIYDYTIYYIFSSNCSELFCITSYAIRCLLRWTNYRPSYPCARDAPTLIYSNYDRLAYKFTNRLFYLRCFGIFRRTIIRKKRIILCKYRKSYILSSTIISGTIHRQYLKIWKRCY